MSAATSDLYIWYSIIIVSNFFFYIKIIYCEMTMGISQAIQNIEIMHARFTFQWD